jgi:hypothetical protein
MKPPTKFIRHKNADEDFADLVACYHNLMHLCEAFDGGKRNLASLIAVEIANLVADEGRDQSPILLRFPRAQEFQFYSTPTWFTVPLGGVIAGKFNLLVMESFRTEKADHVVTMIRSAAPRCWQFAKAETWPTWDLMAFEDWWDGEPVMSESHTVSAHGPKPPYSYTRRGLVKAVRNAKGAHSRGALREDERPLNDPNAFTMDIAYSEKLPSGSEVRHAFEILPSQAALRQIGEELLQSINHNNRMHLFE